MTNATTMKTLPEMQQSTARELATESRTTGNRQYAIACEQMAHAMLAHGAGDYAARNAHIERAKSAHKRAQEDEFGQVMRVKQTATAIAENDLGRAR